MSLLPKILEAKKLQKANEMHSIIWSLSYTLGMSIGGFVVYIFGVKLAFFIDGMMFLGAYLLLVSLKIEIDVMHNGENFIRMMRDTFKYLKREKLALQLMILHAFVGLTAFDALVALMVNQYYAGLLATSLALGMLHSSRAIGLVLGPVILSKYLKHKVVVYIFIAQGVAVLIWSLVMSNFYLSLVASVLVGLFTTTLWSYTYTLLQKNIEEKYYGRIVAYNDMLFLSSAAFTSFMIGYFASHKFSLEYITVIIGSGFFLGAIYFSWILKTQSLKDIS
jgi:MFS family permease